MKRINITIYKGTENVNDKTIVSYFPANHIKNVKGLISYCSMMIATTKKDKSARATFFNRKGKFMVYDIQWDERKDKIITKRFAI